MTLTLIIVLTLLIGINAYLAYQHLHKHFNSPVLEAMRTINVVYDILYEIVNETKVSKASIARSCHTCTEPYAEMLYDSYIENGERYNLKYNRIPIDADIVAELKEVSKGFIPSVLVKNLPQNQKRELYEQEGIIYSETHLIVEVGNSQYVIVLHFMHDDYVLPEEESEIVDDKIARLVKLFKLNTKDL